MCTFSLKNQIQYTYIYAHMKKTNDTLFLPPQLSDLNKSRHLHKCIYIDI